jgi:hypothetical protein
MIFSQPWNSCDSVPGRIQGAFVLASGISSRLREAQRSSDDGGDVLAARLWCKVPYHTIQYYSSLA